MKKKKVKKNKMMRTSSQITIKKIKIMPKEKKNTTINKINSNKKM